MASVSTDKNGKRRILFTDPDENRRTLYLGKVSKKYATSIRDHVEHILTAKLTGHAIESYTAEWLAKIEPPLAKKLARVELIPELEKQEVVTLGPFLEAYIARRNEVKAGTKLNWGHTQRNLLAFFGPDKPLREVSIAEARDFERYLKTGARENRYVDVDKEESLSAATIRKRISNAKQFFGDAVDRRLIDSNPFTKLKGANVNNPTRQFFVTREMTEKLLEACPDSQWRLIVALARYGGLRCPSELVGLLLDDADWERGRLRVRSPKTEHHEGKAERIIPIYDELRPYLEAVWHEAPEGEKYFITRYRSPKQNLRTTFQKIILRAGLTAWPKLFQNIRSSRQTELEESFPSHVVCAWMGNSRAVAEKNYLQVTDGHFTKATQNPTQSESAKGGKGSPNELTAQKKTPVLPGIPSSCENMQQRLVGGTGFEPVTSAV